MRFRSVHVRPCLVHFWLSISWPTLQLLPLQLRAQAKCFGSWQVLIRMFRHETTYLSTSTYLPSYSTTTSHTWTIYLPCQIIVPQPISSGSSYAFTRSQRGIGQHHTVFRESSQSSVRQVRPQTQTEIAIYLGPPTKLRDSENTNICPAKKQNLQWILRTIWTPQSTAPARHWIQANILVFSGHYSPLFDMSRRKKSKSWFEQSK